MTRDQELILIELGLDTLIASVKTKKRKSKKGRKWSKQQHKKFADSMKKTWNKKREQNK